MRTVRESTGPNFSNERLRPRVRPSPRQSPTADDEEHAYRAQDEECHDPTEDCPTSLTSIRAAERRMQTPRSATQHPPNLDRPTPQETTIPSPIAETTRPCTFINSDQLAVSASIAFPRQKKADRHPRAAPPSVPPTSTNPDFVPSSSTLSILDEMVNSPASRPAARVNPATRSTGLRKALSDPTALTMRNDPFGGPLQEDTPGEQGPWTAEAMDLFDFWPPGRDKPG